MVTDQATTPPTSSALLAAVPSVVGVVVAFVSAIVQYAAIDDGDTKKLTGLDAVLGLPSVGVSVIVFSLFVTWFIGASGGARYTHGLSVGAIVVAAIGTAFQLGVVIANFSWVAVVLLITVIGVLLVTILGCRASKIAALAPQIPLAERPKILGIVLVIAGLAGLTAAYNLSVDKVTVVLSPSTSLGCNISILVRCGKNLGSWQGALFGFPNPLIGLGGFAVVLVIGIAVLAGVRYRRWWWVAFNIGVMGAFAFVGFLIYSSVYVLGTLCLWCSLVWAITIPTFWLVTIRNLKEGNLKVGPRATRFFAGAYTWVPILTLACYLIVFLMFEVYLNLLARL